MNRLLRFISLLFGLFLFGVGIVFMLHAKVGYASWDILHDGITKLVPISFGTASIAVGVLLMVILTIFREPIGIGSILNMILVGSFIDLVEWTKLIPHPNTLVWKYVFLFIGFFIIALASYFYIKAGFGAGPRDSLMVLVYKKTPLSIGTARIVVEVSAAFLGYLLGGLFGLGSIISAFAIGIFIEIVFRFFRFDPKTVDHETLSETLHLK